MNTELKKFDELQTQIANLVAPTREVHVTDHDSSGQASKAFRDLSDWEKKVEAKRKELVGPLNAQVDQINEFAKQIKAPLLSAKAHISEELKKFERVLEAQRQEALRIEREEQAKRAAEAQAEIQRQKQEAEAKAKALKEDAEAMSMFDSAGNSEAAMQAAEAEAERVNALARAEAARLEFDAKKTHWDAKKEIAQNKVSGTRRVWTFEVVDMSLVPEEYKIISIDDKKVKRMIALDLREIPGLRIYQDLQITAR